MAKTQNANLGFLSGQQGHVVDDQSSPFKLVQWFNGDPALKGAYGADHPQVTGGFFFKTEQDDTFPLGQDLTYVFRNGDEADMKAIGGHKVIILADRVDFFTGTKQDPQWLGKGQYVKGSKGRNRALLFFEGALDWHREHGPLLLSVYGVNGFMWSKVVSAYKQAILKPAEELSRKNGGPARLDVYTFFAPVVPGPREKANPKYDSMITPPKLDLSGLDEKNPGPFLEGLFIGTEWQNLCAEYWEAAQAWLQEEPGVINNDTPEAAIEAEAEETGPVFDDDYEVDY